MKKILMALIVAACAFGAQADGDWRTTLGKVKDFTADMGFMAFMKKEAPAYITGNFATKDRAVMPDLAKPRTGDNVGANRNGYWDKDGKWVGGYFDDLGSFVKGEAGILPVASYPLLGTVHTDQIR